MSLKVSSKMFKPKLSLSTILFYMESSIINFLSLDVRYISHLSFCQKLDILNSNNQEKL